MEQVYLYEDDQYYIVELDGGEGINIDENCVQYIAVDALKSDEENTIDVNNYDTVEEVICETETESQDAITVSAVYGGVENFDLIVGKENSAVIVEKIPINDENTTKVMREEEIISDVIENNSEIILGQSEISLHVDNVKTSRKLSVIGGTSDLVGDEVTLAVDEEDSSMVIKKHKDVADRKFDTAFVPEVKPFKIAKKAKKRVPLNKKVVKPAVEAPKKILETIKPTPAPIVPSITEELSEILKSKPIKSLTQNKKPSKIKQVKPIKRKRENLKELHAKRMKMIKEEKKSENQSPSKSKSKSLSPNIDQAQATRKSSRKSVKKEFEDFEMEDDLGKKRDYRALTRVVFSPKKDKTMNQNQKPGRKNQRKRRSDSFNLSMEDEMDFEDDDDDEEFLPRANLRVAATIPKKTDKKYRCQYCPNSYDIASSYYNHVRNTHGKDSTPAACDMCPGVFKNRDSLLRHLRLYHTGPDAGKTHVCHICGAKYNLKGGLVSHLKHFHDKEDDDLDEAITKCVKIEETTERRLPKGPTRHTLKFKNNKKRKQKIAVAIEAKKESSKIPNEKKFECELCGAGFTQKSSMYRHVRMNHKNKSSTSKKDNTKDSKKDTTNKETPVKKKINRKASKKVTKKVTKELNIDSTKSNVKDTTANKNGNNDDKPKCKICSRVYSSRQSLSNHVSIKHKQVRVKVNNKKKVKGGKSEKASKFLAMFK